jgi:formylglycine-generating enzyme required for sulfatase activity
MRVAVRKKLLTLCTLIAFSFLVLFNHHSFAQDETPIVRAQALFSQGKYDDAVKMLDGYIGEIQAKPEEKPTLAAAWYLLAKVYFEVGDDAKCDEALINVFNVHPGFDRDEANYGFKARVLKTKAQLAGKLPVAAETTPQPIAVQKNIDTKMPKAVTLPTMADTKTVEQPLKVEKKTIEQKPKIESQTIEMPKPGAVKVLKKKKFPWLVAILGVGVVIVLIVLLGKKKNDPTPTPTPTPTATYANGVLTVNSIRYELALIPAGEFQMGSSSVEANIDEKPVHIVLISKVFWMGRTEVTQGLWQAVMGSNPSSFKNGDTYPVETVSWDDCQSFITKLNQMVGGNAFRLPTEAEWEYACRAGTTGDRYGDLDAIAWYNSNSGNTTHIVGQKQANAWGLFDTLGNVWEWCQDWYGGYGAGYQTDPAGPGSGTSRVLRGGSWYNNAQYGRSSYRYGDDPGIRHSPVGFRLARTN